MFESSNGDFDIQKTHINDRGDFVITAGLTNNGVLGKTDVKAKIFEANTITIDMFGSAFYRQFRYKMVTHARVFSLSPKFVMNVERGLFLTNSLKFFESYFGYENMCSWEKIKNLFICLPITLTGEIDFDFMEGFIRELEEERVRELKFYLDVTELKDYTMTASEQYALNSFDSFDWREYRIGNLFEKIKTNTLHYKAKELPSTAKTDFDLPALTAGIQNQGLNNFVPRKNATILKNVISISANGANTGATFYQSKEFTVLQDAYAINWVYSDEVLTDDKYLFFVGAIAKTIYGNYEWTNKAGWERIKNDKISLPTKKGEPDYDTMETFISAVKKLVIKDVVQYADNKI